ncbi:hypothetical protein [Kineococcus terrestris]|uniref:hypothetical protein n=1 Tax=Kineococcus terrestris TaxID=2044856 RepID=UPI0034DAF937
MAETAAAEHFEPPEGLGARGARLWRDLAGSTMTDAAARVVLEEACRCADRLEQMNGIIAGKGVLQLMHLRSMFELDTEDQRSFTMTVDGVMAEARQQQSTLRQLLAAVTPAAPTGARKPTPAGGEQPRGSFLDRLAQREADGRPTPPRRAGTRGG